MTAITELLATYKSVHFDQKNLISHFIGVPMILWSIALLLSAIEFEIEIAGSIHVFSLMSVCAILLFCYYLCLHSILCCFSILLLTPIYYLATRYTHSEYFYYMIFVSFIMGWLLQFVGHYFEKAKPAFIDDMRQLFVGPLFLVAEIYFFLGFDKALFNNIYTLAKTKRQQLNNQAL